MKKNPKFFSKENFTKDRLWTQVKKYGRRWFVDAPSAMALGLFGSLIIGLTLSQLAKIPVLSFIEPFTEMVKSTNPVVGGAIGAAIAFQLGAKPLVVFSSVATGAFGYAVGGPIGAFVAALFGEEIARLVAGKTPVDIMVTPIVTIVTGCAAGQLVGPGVSGLMNALGGLINSATQLAPLPMGILVAMLVGVVLTSPISSAALCITLNISGIAAGAAVAGCSAQMIGFAVASFKENRWGGLLSQGLGTSKLQLGNALRKPAILLAPTLAGGILGPVSTMVFKMENVAAAAGMGTSGLVGQFGVFQAMPNTPVPILLLQIALLHFILPAILAFFLDKFFRKIGWVKDGDMKIKT